MNEVLGWEGNLTHRQMMGWSVWFEESWHHISLSDHYAMQVSQMIHNVNSRKEKPLESMKIEFKQPPPSQRKRKHKLTKEQAAMFSRAKWCGAVGLTAVKAEDGSPSQVPIKET